ALTSLALLLLLARGPGVAAAQPAAPAQSDYELPAPPALSTATRLDFEADHVDYDASSATMRLKGRVVVKESTRTIKADELSMDTRARTGRAQGFLLVEDGGSAVAAEDGGFFDFEQKTGELHKAS